MEDERYRLSFRRALDSELLKHLFGPGDILVHIVPKQHGIRHLLHGFLMALLCHLQQLFV